MGTWKEALFGEAKKAEFPFFFSWQDSLWDSDCLWTPCFGSMEFAWEHFHAQAISEALCSQQRLQFLVPSHSQGQIKCEGVSIPNPFHLSLMSQWGGGFVLFSFLFCFALFFQRWVLSLAKGFIYRFKDGLNILLKRRATTEKHILHSIISLSLSFSLFSSLLFC